MLLLVLLVVVTGVGVALSVVCELEHVCVNSSAQHTSAQGAHDDTRLRHAMMSLDQK